MLQKVPTLNVSHVHVVALNFGFFTLIAQRPQCELSEMVFGSDGLQDGGGRRGPGTRDIPPGATFIPTGFGLLLHPGPHQETLWCAGGSEAAGEI
jgi:hypothetical protein